jgi:hypothetical protein
MAFWQKLKIVIRSASLSSTIFTYKKETTHALPLMASRDSIQIEENCFQDTWKLFDK